MRVVFFGSDAIALPALDFLRSAEGVELTGVVSQPDRPSGRGRHLHANPVAAWAREQGIALRQPEKPGTAVSDWMRETQTDVALVMAYGHILQQHILDAAPQGTWNLHGSILPAYRGASPVESALAAGDKETGVCLMRMVLALDAGPVADVERISIEPVDTGAKIREVLGLACVPLLKRNLKALGDGSLKTNPQDDGRATFTRKLIKADAQLDFSMPASLLERRMRALCPWPGTVVDHGGCILKVGAARIVENPVSVIEPGTVIQIDPEGLDVATGEGVLRLLTLQRPGGQMLAAAEFLRGYPMKAGEKFTSHPMLPLVSSQPFPRLPKRVPAA